MRFYVASGLENAARVKLLLAAVQQAGHIVTYDWTVHGAVQKAGELPDDIREKLSTTARAERNGVASADIVIVLLPGGRGTHVELGIALASLNTILMVVPPEAKAEHPCCVFHYSPGVAQAVLAEELTRVSAELVVDYACAIHKGGVKHHTTWITSGRGSDCPTPI